MIVSVQNLCKSFGQSVVLQKGEIYSILGVNGTGKITLMKLLPGLQKTDEGSILVFGKNISETDTYLSSVGSMIEFPSFYEHISAAENLEIHLAFLSNAAIMLTGFIVSKILGLEISGSIINLAVTVPLVCFLTALISSSVGIISVTIGKKKRSEPAAIVSSFIIGCVLAQCFSVSYNYILPVTAVACAVIVATAIFVYGILEKDIEKLEV